MKTDPFERDVNTAAAHILQLLDSVQEQLASIRKTAEELHTKEGTPDAAQS